MDYRGQKSAEHDDLRWCWNEPHSRQAGSSVDATAGFRACPQQGTDFPPATSRAAQRGVDSLRPPLIYWMHAVVPSRTCCSCVRWDNFVDIDWGCPRFEWKSNHGVFATRKPTLMSDQSGG